MPGSVCYCKRRTGVPTPRTPCGGSSSSSRPRNTTGGEHTRPWGIAGRGGGALPGPARAGDTPPPPRLERPCMALLQTTLCSPTCPEQLQLLCAAVLREMSPCDSLSLSCDHIQNTRQLGLVASVLLAQVT